MTTRLTHQETSHRLSDGRLGALAAFTPIAMFGAWVVISGWGGTPFELIRGLAGIGLGAAAAGWIVGARVGRSVVGQLIGLVAYGLVAYLLLLPLDVLGATWEDVGAGRTSSAVELVVGAGLYLLYGLVSGIWVSVFLLPFGVGWIGTFVLLRRALGR